MSTNTAKETAIRIAIAAKEQRIRFPLTWDESQIKQAIGALLMMNRLEDGSFNDVAVTKALIEKYGQTEDLSKKRELSISNIEESEKEESEEDSEDDRDDTDQQDDDEDEQGQGQLYKDKESIKKKKTKRVKKEKKPKIKKTEVIVNEANRGIAVAIKEIASIHFQNKDVRKGSVFSKAAKALRECEIPIRNKKEAMSLPGVGAGIAGYIVEYLEKGSISKLEEMRAGTA